MGTQSRLRGNRSATSRAALWLAPLGLLSAALAACGDGNVGDNGAHPSGATTTPGAAGPGAAELRRLTNKEYAASVARILGVDPTAVVATFPEDVATAGFDNASLTQTVSATHAERYMVAAQTFAADVTGSPELASKVIGCDPIADRPGCLDSFVRAFGRRLYRRPITDDEVGRFLTLSKSEPDGMSAAETILEAALQSPSFLFRVELGVADPEHPDRMRLTGYEVATRLSFFFWGESPDDALLDAAAAGALDTAEGVGAQARAMIGDPRLAGAMDDFTFQWFELDRVLGAKRDATQYPEWSPALADAMVEEVQRLLADHMWGQGASFLDVFTTQKGYANDVLATIYGVDPPAGSDFGPIDWTASASANGDRGGLFTTAAFLTATTRGNATSPIQRGKYIRDVALCDPLPPPPNGVPQIQQKPGQTAADAEDAHTADPACAGCHIKINPIGNGLERYDALGRVRATYTDQSPVKQDGTIDGLEGSDFSGGAELGQIVADSDMGRACVVAHAFRWAFGRTEDESDDADTLAALAARFAEAKFAFPELLVAITKSEAFRYRRAAQ